MIKRIPANICNGCLYQDDWERCKVAPECEDEDGNFIFVEVEDE